MRRLALILMLLLPWAAHALETVTLQLNWKHQFQFAGYYAAIDKGYFRAAGYDVKLQEAVEGHDPLQNVLNGEATFGVAASELALQRGRGAPVVALAVILQHSPLVLLTNRQRADNIHALAGQRIMLMPHETELYAYFRQEGISNFQAEQHSFDPADLISGKVAAISGYSTDEPFLLEQAGFSFATFTPRSVGIDFYGDTLFTTEQAIKANPEGVRAFRAAALKGWQYAMEHPAEIADLIVARYSTRHSRAHLLFEAAEMQRLMRADLVDVGHQSQGRWQQIARHYSELGMLPRDAVVKGLIYQAEPAPLPEWVWPIIALVGIGMLLAAYLAFYFARLNGRLGREIDGRSAVEKALRRSEERYRMLAEQSKDVIWTLDLNSRRFSYISPSVERLRGFTAEEVMAAPMERALTPDSLAKVQVLLADSLARVSQGDFAARFANTEIEQPHKNGGTISTEVATAILLDETGQPYAVHGITRDVSERKAAQTRLQEVNEQLLHKLDEIEQLQLALQEQAVRDPLTGCFNRRYFDETLERELSRARREGYPLALIILDLDHFKQINDTYGHQAGDEALKLLADTLKGETRQEDLFCRYGGEEFVILMPRLALPLAAEKAERWRQMIGEISFRFGNFALRFTASLGVTAYPDHGKVPDELKQAADLALYLAKHEGRNRVVVYEPPVD